MLGIQFGCEHHLLSELELRLVFREVEFPCHVVELDEHVSSLLQGPVLILVLSNHHGILRKPVIFKFQVLLPSINYALSCQCRLQSATLVDLFPLLLSSLRGSRLIIVDSSL